MFEESLGLTAFEYRRHNRRNIANRTETESAISEMLNLIIPYKKLPYEEDVEKEARIKAKKRSDVVLQLK